MYCHLFHSIHDSSLRLPRFVMDRIKANNTVADVPMAVTICSIQKYLKPVKRRKNVGREFPNYTPNDRLRSSSSHLNENILSDYSPSPEEDVLKCKRAVGTLLLQRNRRREEIEATTKEDTSDKSLEIISLPPPSVTGSTQRRVIFDQSSPHASLFQKNSAAARCKCILSRGFATNISLLSQATNDGGEQREAKRTSKEQKNTRTNINSSKTRGRLAEIDHMRQVYIAQQKRHNLSPPNEMNFPKF